MADAGRPLVSESLTRIALRKLRRHSLALVGGGLLVLLYGLMLGAGFVAPYNFDTSARLKNFHSPSVIRFVDEDGNLRRPFVYDTVKTRDDVLVLHYPETPDVPTGALVAYQRDMKAVGDPEEARRIAEEDRLRRYPIRLFVQGEDYLVLGPLLGQLPGCDWTWDVHLFGIESEDDGPLRPMLYLIGSDDFGRDLFSRILYGAWVSLTVGLVGISITFTIGMMMGGASGYFGGKTDLAIQRLIEMLLMFPSFFLLLALAGSLPAEMGSTLRYLMIIMILALIGWAGLARTIRGLVLSIATMDYVQAARALGVGHFTIIRKHILPNTLSYAIVAATLTIPGYMLGESALSFLALGVQEPDASWGNMLRLARTATWLKHYPWILAPGAFIFLTVLAFNFLGDGLRDAFDPKSLTVGSED